MVRWRRHCGGVWRVHWVASRMGRRVGRDMAIVFGLIWTRCVLDHPGEMDLRSGFGGVFRRGACSRLQTTMTCSMYLLTMSSSKN